MSIVQLSGCALLSAVVILLLRFLRTELALPVRVAALIAVLGGALALYLPILEQMRALLSFAEGGTLAAPLLRAIKEHGSLPFVTKAADYDDPLFALDVRAQDLWSLGCTSPLLRRAGRDYTTSPVIV
jgi:hypothetical protein